MVWEAIFLLLVLKIPIVYLCLVVWWAIRAEPRPEEGAALVARISPTDPEPCSWREQRRIRALRPRPRRGPGGRPARVAHAPARGSR